MNNKKVLILFGIDRMDNMLKKGNLWYVRHYESYFEKVYVVYLMGTPHKPLHQGRTIVISLGCGRRFFNLVIAPVRLLIFCQKKQPTDYLTADLIFSWWTTCLVKLFMFKKIRLLPVYIPERIYKSTGKSITGLPIFIERFLVRLCYFSAYRILSVACCAKWLKNIPDTHKKLCIYEKDPESLPSQMFFDNLKSVQQSHTKLFNPAGFNMIYVGRLHHEKFVHEIIRMFDYLDKLCDTPKFLKLYLIGDGPEKSTLISLINELKLEDKVSLLGSVPNSKLPYYYMAADLFISTLTGTSLREAALCGVPVIAYDLDWVSEALTHMETAFLVPAHDYRQLAEGVLRLIIDDQLRAKLSENISFLAWQLWSPENLSLSLQKAFSE